ncbi:hypothetical protein NH340_JMT04196 [Sarcoptes scabiei]|nr:hypothetical protein NH340_JMT04196 [Sarcoptes scabiei]
MMNTRIQSTNLLGLFLISTLTFVAIVEAENLVDAIQQCQNFHHVDIDTNGTGYVNEGCRLQCEVHGKVHMHNVNENGYCCQGGICQQGECVLISKNGHIDIEIVAVSLYRAANAYASVCLLNNSDPVILPLRDRTQCVTCSTHVSKSRSDYVVWNQWCNGSHRYLFRQNSRVVFELWDYKNQVESKKNNRVTENSFIGGSTLTVNEILSHGYNGKLLYLALKATPYPGQLTARVVWTPAY